MNNSWNSPVLPPAGYNRNSGAPVANHAHSHSAASAVSPTSSTSGGGAAGGVKFMPTVSTIGFPAPSGVSRGNVIANRNASGFDQSELQQRLRQRNNKNREQQQQLNNNSSVLNSASRYESRLSENHHNNNNDDDDEELYRELDHFSSFDKMFKQNLFLVIIAKASVQQPVTKLFSRYNLCPQNSHVVIRLSTCCRINLISMTVSSCLF